MRIATWNINSIAARQGFLLDFLKARSPDLLMLQELKVTDDAFPRAAVADAGYVSLLHGQPQWNGVAVLVKSDALGGGPAALVQSGLPGQEALGARLVTVAALGMTVTSVYIPNGKSVSHPDFALKLGWLDALREHVAGAQRAGDEVVIGGDFNLCPADIDSWAPDDLRGHIFHTDEERDRWKKLVALGYFDLYREKEPETTAFSWWDYRGGSFHKKQGLRIDFLLGSKRVLDRTTKVWIDRDFRKKREGLIPSDHAPVIAELEDEK